jgi:hypothetical protein
VLVQTNHLQFQAFRLAPPTACLRHPAAIVARDLQVSDTLRRQPSLTHQQTQSVAASLANQLPSRLGVWEALACTACAGRDTFRDPHGLGGIFWGGGDRVIEVAIPSFASRQRSFAPIQVYSDMYNKRLLILLYDGTLPNFCFLTGHSLRQKFMH